MSRSPLDRIAPPIERHPAVTVLAPIERKGSGGIGIDRRLTNHSSVSSVFRPSTRSRMMRPFMCVIATPWPVQPIE